MRRRHLAVSALLSLALSLAAVGASVAAPMNVVLHFSSLPTAQGFTYHANGAHAGVLESSVFTANGTALVQNTIGQYAGVNGAGLFYQIAGGITTTEMKQLRVRARCLQVQGSSVFPLGQGGLLFSFATGSVQYGFTLTDDRIGLLIGSGYTMLAPTYDNTQFHDYVYEFAPPTTTRLYRDGVLISTSTLNSAIVANRLLFGDSTGGANAHAEITEFQFIQDLATPAEASSWGRVKRLYR